MIISIIIQQKESCLEGEVFTQIFTEYHTRVEDTTSQCIGKWLPYSKWFDYLCESGF